MELLSNSNASMQHNSPTDSKPKDGNSSDRLLLSGILESLPGWDIPNAITVHNTPPSRRSNNFFASNFGFVDTQDFIPTIRKEGRSLSDSPESNHSRIGCGWCDSNAMQRCLDCNEFLCANCLSDHRIHALSANHTIVALPTPIGTSPTTGQLSSTISCDTHNEMLRFVCEQCKTLICQYCTLCDHKDHTCTTIQAFVDEANAKIDSALESSRVGTKCIKGSIDTALSYIRLVERDCMEQSDNVRKAFRQFIIAVEDRERFLLDAVQKLRQRRLAVLHEQMAGLKSALSGLAETSEMLHSVTENGSYMSQKDIALNITKGQRQLEQFAAIYKDLQPKKAAIVFLPPDYSLLQDLRSQGNVSILEEKAMMSNLPGPPAHFPGMINVLNRLPNLPSSENFHVPQIFPAQKYDELEWKFNVQPGSSLYFGASGITQCIAGCSDTVKAQSSSVLSLSFATEGHDDGKVSRPWGVCVDKSGNIIISDRRNNRVQVFNCDGIFKFKFGRKGVGNGEFDLPAGICVDIDNRIIVVDKDNHRVQIFTSAGVFLSKFGKYGKEYGQFQYPWDIAVNAQRQIVVTDSRNNRIQQFDSEGRFIRQLVFDNSYKGIASPRGVCYTPQGNIIVSDFDNHCLYLIDSELNNIISAKGQEGSGLQEFNRPSGLTCDDDGRVIVADSKNQRVMVFSPNLEFLWDIEVRPSKNPAMPKTVDEKDRTCDVALMPDGRIVFLLELSPDSKDGYNPNKKFVHIF